MLAGAVVAVVLTRVATQSQSTGQQRGPAIAISDPPAVQSAPRLVVDIAGAVRRPGVYEVVKGSRVRDVVRRAGGLRRNADLTGVNRAAHVVDGQQIIIPGRPARGVAANKGQPASRTSAGAGSLVSINSADVTALDGLPGIGPVTAQKIIDDRTEHGSFSSIDDLDRVAGIGPATMRDLRDLITV